MPNAVRNRCAARKRALFNLSARIPLSIGHYENFPVASVLVPKRLRGAVIAIYRFARAADDLADEGNALPAERIGALDAFECELDAIARGDAPTRDLFRDLALAIRAHALPVAPMRDLLSAFRQDVSVARYARFADVLD